MEGSESVDDQKTCLAGDRARAIIVLPLYCPLSLPVTKRLHAFTGGQNVHRDSRHEPVGLCDAVDDLPGIINLPPDIIDDLLDIIDDLPEFIDDLLGIISLPPDIIDDLPGIIDDLPTSSVYL